MAEYTARLDLRVSTDQRTRLDELADRLELPPAAVVRAMLDGCPNIDGVELLPTLARLSMVEPNAYGQVDNVIRLPKGTRAAS